MSSKRYISVSCKENVGSMGKRTTVELSHLILYRPLLREAVFLEGVEQLNQERASHLPQKSKENLIL